MGCLIREKGVIMHKILIADDDRDIVDVLKLYLQNSNFDTVICNNGQEAIETIENDKIDLALLDIMMPEKDGYEVATYIRKNYNIPIIFITAKNTPSEVILGLDVGADDYITKPFNPLEVIARINSAIRRYYVLNNSKQPDSILQVGNILIDKDKMEVRKDGISIPLTVTEYRILYCLMKDPGKVLTKKQICNYIYGDDYMQSDDNSLSVHISKIRSKLESENDNTEYIKNVRGLGYKFEKKQ